MSGWARKTHWAALKSLFWARNVALLCYIGVGLHVHGSVWRARVPVHDYDMLCEGLAAWNTSKYDALGESTLFWGLLYVR